MSHGTQQAPRLASKRGHETRVACTFLHGAQSGHLAAHAHTWRTAKPAGPLQDAGVDEHEVQSSTL